MDVNSVSSSSMVASTSAAATASKKATLDYDTFLTLLVQQMKNQDPTEPMDATNKNLENLLQSSTLNQAGTIIGRTITSADESVSGVIKEVQVYSDGLIAILESGEKVLVGAGVTIS